MSKRDINEHQLYPFVRSPKKAASRQGHQQRIAAQRSIKGAPRISLSTNQSYSNYNITSSISKHGNSSVKHSEENLIVPFSTTKVAKRTLSLSLSLHSSTIICLTAVGHFYIYTNREMTKTWYKQGSREVKRESWSLPLSLSLQKKPSERNWLQILK